MSVEYDEVCGVEIVVVTVEWYRGERRAQQSKRTMVESFPGEYTRMRERSPGHSESDGSSYCGSVYSRRVTRSTAVRPLLSFTSKFPKPRKEKMENLEEFVMEDGSDPGLSMAEVIAKHVMSFGLDFRGVQKDPPRIPLCRLVHMEIVRTLQKESASIEKLKDSFRSSGYNSSIGMRFYVQPTDSNGDVQLCTPEIRETWDPIWVSENEKFEAECDADPNFLVLKDKMFSVFDGNHRLYSWTQVTMENPENVKYHPRVLCTIFKGNKESIIEIEAAMHTVNQ